ncbi:hypothetical protein Z947_1669 [Sulfitobacter geojensis]|nr:hypothetical protein Z947_1669 [Sulfitobacter geojensis]
MKGCDGGREIYVTAVLLRCGLVALEQLTCSNLRNAATSASGAYFGAG